MSAAPVAAVVILSLDHEDLSPLRAIGKLTTFIGRPSRIRH